MKTLLLILSTAIYLSLPILSLGAEQALENWDFTKASDTLGWTTASGTMKLNSTEKALTARAGTDVSKLISPLFDIKAEPWQYVEIEMKNDADGTALLYYSNTTDEPYAGFRPQLFAQFIVKGDGKYHKYTILPFWQAQGKIIHIRLDPPGNSSSVRSIKITTPGSVTPITDTSFKFTNTTANWTPLGSAEIKTLPAGCSISGDNDATFISPPLDMNSHANHWVTLRIASATAHTLLFRWATADRIGLQVAPIQLHADGAVHSYPIDLSKISEWHGKILAIAISPTDSAEKQSALLESITFGNSPTGPAELRIKRFELSDPITRAGEKAKIVVDAQNVGSEDARTINAVVTILHDTTPEVLPVQTRDKLASGEIAHFEWTYTSKQPETLMAACSAGAQGVSPEQQQASLQFYPKLDDSLTKGLTYVPEPQPADTGDYLVGAYYFPGWRDYGAWSVLNDFPERKPLLGYYNDGSPEVADWHINWALSHGINYFIYDWYWQKGGRSLEEGLRDGFLKSRYGSKMKFCLLWANHNAAGTSSEEDLMNVTRFWIENYFNRPNYLKINGKNVMVIFAPGRFTEDMGIEAVKAAFTKMRKLCEDAGVGGLYLVACAGPDKNLVKQIVDEGYDAISGYNYPWAGDRGRNVAPYEWMVDGYKNVWDQMTELASGIPYIPLCEAGWDSRPWHGINARIRTGKTPELWQKMLSNAKAYTDDPNHKLPEGKKLIFCEAWNEYGEGDYIEPHAQYGFGYLEAVRQVFAPRSKEPALILPKDLGMGPYDIKKPEVKIFWDFIKPEDRTWRSWNTSELTYSADGMVTSSTNDDPALLAPATEINASSTKTMEIKLKLDKSGEAQLFFTQFGQGMSEDKSVRFRVTGDNQFHVYTVDLSANEYWEGKIAQIRFDPTSAPDCKIEVAYVRFK